MFRLFCYARVDPQRYGYDSHHRIEYARVLGHPCYGAIKAYADIEHPIIYAMTSEQTTRLEAQRRAQPHAEQVRVVADFMAEKNIGVSAAAIVRAQAGRLENSK